MTESVFCCSHTSALWREFRFYRSISQDSAISRLLLSFACHCTFFTDWPKHKSAPRRSKPLIRSKNRFNNQISSQREEMGETTPQTIDELKTRFNAFAALDVSVSRKWPRVCSFLQSFGHAKTQNNTTFISLFLVQRFFFVLLWNMWIVTATVQFSFEYLWN